jgi:hypothetical protein
LAQLVREMTGPEPLQPNYLGGDRLPYTRNDTMPQSQLGVEFGTHLRNSQIGCADALERTILQRVAHRCA